MEWRQRQATDCRAQYSPPNDLAPMTAGPNGLAEPAPMEPALMGAAPNGLAEPQATARTAPGRILRAKRTEPMAAQWAGRWDWEGEQLR